MKNEYCLKNKIPLLRIRFDETDKINDLVITFLKEKQYVKQSIRKNP